MGLHDVRRRLPVVDALPRSKTRRRLPLKARERHLVLAVWEFTLACDQRCRACGPRAGKARPDELSTDEALCFYVDAATNTGECVEICAGSSDAPICPLSSQICVQTNNGSIALCLPGCDPLAPDCDEGLGCFATEAGFACLAPLPYEGSAGAPCEYLNGCDPGQQCIGADLFRDCLSGIGCCAPVCDVTDPAADASCAVIDPASSCVPWPASDPGVGVCATADVSGTPSEMAWPHPEPGSTVFDSTW